MNDFELHFLHQARSAELIAEADAARLAERAERGRASRLATRLERAMRRGKGRPDHGASRLHPAK